MVVVRTTSDLSPQVDMQACSVPPSPPPLPGLANSAMFWSLRIQTGRASLSCCSLLPLVSRRWLLGNIPLIHSHHFRADGSSDPHIFVILMATQRIQLRLPPPYHINISELPCVCFQIGVTNECGKIRYVLTFD